MANVTVEVNEKGAYERTLTAETVDTVTFDGSLFEVEVISDGAAPLYFTLDGSDPVVGGAACYHMPAIASVREVRVDYRGGVTVKLISEGTPTYSVSRSERGD